MSALLPSALKTSARRVAAAFAGMGLALLVLGCGDDTGLAKRYPVSGTVTYNGAPVAKGTINFVVVSDTGRAATGAIENGRYALTTATQGDGALPGSYKVTVISQDIDTAALTAESKGGQFHHGSPEFIKATKNAKNLVPPKYKLADTSDLKAEVKAETNTLNFDLKD
jgi:hypothetical protein